MQSVKEIASRLKLTPGRIRQIIWELDFQPADKIGNVPLYNSIQIDKITRRNTKPGPRKPKAKK